MASEPNYFNGILRLRADVRFTIYDLEQGGHRIVLTGERSGERLTRDVSIGATLYLFYEMMRMYLAAAKTFARKLPQHSGRDGDDPII